MVNDGRAVLKLNRFWFVASSLTYNSHVGYALALRERAMMDRHVRLSRLRATINVPMHYKIEFDGDLFASWIR